MLSRCCSRSLASRGGWHLAPLGCQARHRTSRSQRSLDEPTTRGARSQSFFENKWTRFREKADGHDWERQNGDSSRAGTIGFWATVMSTVIGVSVGTHMEWLESPQPKKERRTLAAFQPRTLVSKQTVSSTMSIFHMKAGDDDPYQKAFSDAWSKGIWNMLFKQPQIQVVRAYTPLPPVSENGAGEDLRFLIRHDQRGEVSGWLHRLPPGSNVEMRGPNIELEMPSDPQYVTFLAGGTGIATALQAAHALLKRGHEDASSGRQKRPATIHILWANRSREDCQGGISDSCAQHTKSAATSLSSLFSAPSGKRQPEPVVDKGVIVQELDALKARYPNQFSVDYFVDEENTWITGDVVAMSLLQARQTGGSESSEAPRRQVLVSGPEGFVNYCAGPKSWYNGQQEQGTVSGIVAQAISQSKDTSVKVWKV